MAASAELRDGTAATSNRFARRTYTAGRNDMVDQYDDDRPVERTTIIETGGDRGGGGVLAVVLLIIVVLALLFLFRDQLGFGANKTEVSIPDKIEVNVN
jgi:hypothetical protein